MLSTICVVVSVCAISCRTSDIRTPEPEPSTLGDERNVDIGYTLTRKDIMDAASVAAREHGWNPEGSDIIYDGNNTLLNFFVFVPSMRTLDGRRYRTVIYRSRESTCHRDLWISIDECTGEVLNALEVPKYGPPGRTVGVQTIPKSRTQDSRTQTHGGKRALSRGQIINAARAAAKQRSWNPDESHIIYDEGNAIWRFYWPTYDIEYESHDYQVIIFRRRVAIPGGDLFVVVDGQAGEVMMVHCGE
jgi:hypothetical protein